MNDKKKQYMMGDTRLSEQEKQSMAQAQESRNEELKKHLENQKKEEVKQHDWDKPFPWKINGDRVIIFPDPTDVQLPSGIIIPDTGKERPQTGLVVAFGDELTTTQQIIERLKNIEMSVAAIGRHLNIEETASLVSARIDGQEHIEAPVIAVGQRVLFGRFAGHPITVDEVCYLIIRYADIFASL